MGKHYAHAERMSGDHHQRQNGARAPWPDTQMAHAFLIGLAKFVCTHHENDGAKVMLPIGAFNVGELIQFLRALERARREVRSVSSEIIGE